MEGGFRPGLLGRGPPVLIHSWSELALGGSMISAASVGQASAAWPAAGLVIYVPVTLTEPVLVTKVFWAFGVPAGNVDAGVFDEAGNVLLSAGTTAVAGTNNTAQAVDVTDTVIGRGRYYLGMAADTVTTLTIARGALAAGIYQSFGLLEQASVTLPLATGANPGTFAKYTRAYVPLFGIQGFRGVGP